MQSEKKTQRPGKEKSAVGKRKRTDIKADGLYTIGADAPERLRKIADDPDTPLKLRVEIEKWIAEMVFGRPKLQPGTGGDREGGGSKGDSSITVKFEGELEQWSR